MSVSGAQGCPPALSPPTGGSAACACPGLSPREHSSPSFLFQSPRLLNVLPVEKFSGEYLEHEKAGVTCELCISTDYSPEVRASSASASIQAGAGVLQFWQHAGRLGGTFSGLLCGCTAGGAGLLPRSVGLSRHPRPSHGPGSPPTLVCPPPRPGPCLPLLGDSQCLD